MRRLPLRGGCEEPKNEYGESGAPALSESFSNSDDEGGVIERFVEVTLESRRLRPLMVASVGETGDRDDRRMVLSVDTTQLAEKLEAIHSRHPQVAQYEIGVL